VSHPARHERRLRGDRGPAGSIEALRSVFRNPNLRRLQLAWAGSNLGTWGYGIALAVYACDQGGAQAVGLVALLRWIPAAIAAPFMGVLGDRHSRRLVMVASDLGRVVVIVLAAIGVVMSTAFRPAQSRDPPCCETCRGRPARSRSPSASCSSSKARSSSPP
jgi:hypothetical protein